MREIKFIDYFWFSLIFLFIVVLSFILRLPYLNRPLSGNYEWLTAHTLITFEIWHQEGIFQHGFLPVYSYADTLKQPIYIGDLGSAEKNHRMYYISYPSFGLVIPYLLTGGHAYLPLILKIFNILLHFLECFFLWKILCIYFQPQTVFLAVLYYLFHPNLLWFHGNVYFIDVLSLTWFIIQIYFTQKFLENSNVKNAFYWFLTNFLLCQTEWLGYLVLFTAGLFFLYNKNWYAFFLLIFWGLLNLGFTLWQYGSFLGYENYFSALFQKFLKRIGTSQASSHNWGEWKPFVFFLLNFFIYQFTIFLALYAHINLIFTQKLFVNRDYVKIVLFALVPVWLHYILLYNFTTGHSPLASLIATPFLIFLLAIFLEKLFTLESNLGKKIGIAINFFIIFLGISFFLIRNNLSFQQYFKQNLVTSYVTVSNEFKILGEYIAQNTPKDYLPCILYPKFIVNPQIHYYSKRNVLQFYDRKEIEEYVSKHKIKLKIYEINENLKVINVSEVKP